MSATAAPTPPAAVATNPSSVVASAAPPHRWPRYLLVFLAGLLAGAIGMVVLVAYTTPPSAAEIEEAMRRTVLPRLEFREARIVEVLAAIWQPVCDAWPRMRSVRVLYYGPDDTEYGHSAQAVPVGSFADFGRQQTDPYPDLPDDLRPADAAITLEIRNMPAWETLRYSCTAAGKAWLVQDNGILVYTPRSSLTWSNPPTFRQRWAARVRGWWTRLCELLSPAA